MQDLTLVALLSHAYNVYCFLVNFFVIEGLRDFKMQTFPEEVNTIPFV
jgi:hypothetical protein